MLPDPLLACSALTGGCLLTAGIVAQVRAHRIRRHWASVGMGLEERATGLASLAAVPVLFPAELETAAATGTKLAVLVLRRFSEHPRQFGRRLRDAIRAHETGWRVDYDLFAVTIVVADRGEAVRAAARIGDAACGTESRRDLRIGIAMCPDDGDDLLDAVDVGMRRMRGFALLDAVAAQLRRLEEGPVVVADDATAVG